MPTSKRETLLAAAKTALEASSVSYAGGSVTKPTLMSVRRHPERPAEFTSTLTKVVDLYAISERPVGEITNGVLKVLTLGCLCRTTWLASASSSGDAALDELLSWVEAALMTGNGTLSGAAAMMSAPTLERPAVEERSDKYAEAVLSFDITYEVRFGDPWTAP